MDEAHARERDEYQAYIRGCRQFDWQPLSAEMFRSLYGRYRRCSRAIQRYEQRRNRRLAKRTGSACRDDAFLERLIRSIRHERERLDYLSTAVSAGQRGEEENGGAGMPAYRRPDLPVLVGAGAKLHPELDPEPPVRDP